MILWPWRNASGGGGAAPRSALMAPWSGAPTDAWRPKEPFWKFVGEYWHAIGSRLTGRDFPAWSAAFISYCFIEANAGARFPSDDESFDLRFEYRLGPVSRAVAAGSGDGSARGGRSARASRSGDQCRTPPRTFAAARTELRRIRQGADSFCSHADIVIAVRPGEADVIGGNVKNAVTRTTFKLNFARLHSRRPS